MNKIGHTLKELRKSNGFSIIDIIKKLAEINIVVKQKTIYKWENDICIPNIQTINALSHIYGISLTSLYEDTSFCKSLNQHENCFIDFLRSNKSFRKLAKQLINLNMSEEDQYG